MKHEIQKTAGATVDWATFSLVTLLALTLGPVPADVGADHLPEPRRGHEDVPEILRDDKLVDEKGFKYRVMVDKTHFRPNKSVQWHVKKGLFKRWAELGFNILCPRWFRGASQEKIVKAARRAGEQGMYYFQHDRGSFREKHVEGSTDSPHFVYRDGTRYEAISPSSEAFWNTFEKRVMRAVRASTKAPVLGMHLGFEKYEKRGGFVSHWYPVSYDDHSWTMFFEDRERAAPERPAAERHDWLKKHGLLRAYRQFHTNLWKRKASELREKIDAINPRFRFQIHPAWGPRFIKHVMFGPLSTEKAPVLPAEHMTFTRGHPLKNRSDVEPARFSDDQALRLDLAYMKKKNWFYNRSGEPHASIGGINATLNGSTDAQLVARKMHLFSRHHDGYWIWYQSVPAKQDNMFKRWFKLANRAIKHGHDSVRMDLRDDNPHIAEQWLDRLEATGW